MSTHICLLALCVSSPVDTQSDESSPEDRIETFFSQSPDEAVAASSMTGPGTVMLVGKAVKLSPEKLAVVLGRNANEAGAGAEMSAPFVVEVDKGDVVDLITAEEEGGPDLVLVRGDAVVSVRAELPIGMMVENASSGASEGLFDRIVRRIPIPRIPTRIGASIRFKNSTGSAITVVLDTNRERHVIAPGGQVTFTNASVGDRPTIRVLNQRGQAIASRTFGPIGLNSRFDYQGGTSF